MNTEEYTSIFKFLKYNEYPFSDSKIPTFAKRNFRRKANNFQICSDNKLYKYQLNEGAKQLFEVVKDNDVNDILKLYHDNTGHPGINTTIRMVKQKHHWPTLNKDVTNYVKTCHVCQMTSSLPPNPTKKLHPITAPEKQWKHIGIDLICDLNENSEGYKHILVTVCYLSKFFAARPLKTKTTKEVISQLEDIYFTLGVPEIIQHDLGPEFTSREFKEFHSILRVENRSTTAYHPQSNGLVEAHNKILKTKLYKMCMETGEKWTSHLQAAILASNICWKRSTRYSPFYLMYGREANSVHLQEYHIQKFANIQSSDYDFSIEFSDTIELTEIKDNTEIFKLHENAMNIHKSSLKEARENIFAEQLVQRSVFNKKLNKSSSEIKAGDEFIYRNMAKAKKLPGTKDKCKFFGPVTASTVTQSHAVINLNGSSKKIPLHISLPYHSRKRKCITSSENMELSSKKIKTPQKKDDEETTKEKDNRDCLTFGISFNQIETELSKFKVSFSDHKIKGVHFSALHEKLEKDFKRKGYYIPCTLLYNVLKDSTGKKVKEEILSILMEYSEGLYPNIGSSRSCDYVYKILYGVALEYITTNLLDKNFEKSINFHQLSEEDPVIMPLTLKWQQDKCHLLNIPFVLQIDQQYSLAGEKLKHYEPLRCESIVGDGNCLFRCLSMVISGSEKYYSLLRAEICRFIISDGCQTMGGYLKQFNTTPYKYIEDSGMLDDGIWGTDVEIMAASAMLNTDIYIANRIYKTDLIPEIRWSRIRCTNNTLNNNAIYIANFFQHYEPVTRFLNSLKLTFSQDTVDEINLI